MRRGFKSLIPLHVLSLPKIAILAFFVLAFATTVYYVQTYNTNPITKASETDTQPQGPIGKFDLIFNDEFSGSIMDTTKWLDCKRWQKFIDGKGQGCNINGNSMEWNLPQNLTFSDGKVNMQAKYEPFVNSDGHSHDYTSGMIIGQDVKLGTAKFGFQYGYVEARFKAASAVGAWSSLWMDPVSEIWPPEIDIFEILGREKEKLWMNTHFIENGGHQHDPSSIMGTDFTAGPHVVGMEWSPTKMQWFVDGDPIPKKTFERVQFIPREPMYLIMNLAVGGWGGTPVINEFPTDFWVDYVRVWKRHIDQRLIVKLGEKASGQKYVFAKWSGDFISYPNFDHYEISLADNTGVSTQTLNTGSETDYKFKKYKLENGKYNLVLKSFFKDGTSQTDVTKFKYKNGTLIN